tara:strand:- start:1289 stop:1720 length:432 start_codon:yes stop_codon:yes gene_type:complete
VGLNSAGDSVHQATLREECGPVLDITNYPFVLEGHSTVNAAVSGPGVQTGPTVPADQYWRVLLVTARLLSGVYTINNLLFRPSYGGQVLLLPGTSSTYLLYNPGRYLPLGPGAILEVEVDGYTSNGNLEINAIYERFPVEGTP